MGKIATRSLVDNKPIKAKKVNNANKFYANKNKMDLFDFMKKTGKDFPSVDKDGNWIVDKNSKQSRWLED